MPNPRLAVRAIIVEKGRLLLVNAWPDGKSDLLCAPGGGVELHSSLPENLAREVYEETGLTVQIGAPCLVNEFHDPNGRFHQVEIFFHAKIVQGQIDPTWQDPERIVTERRWVTRAEMADLKVKPSCLADVAFGDGFTYDALEPIVM